MVKAREKNKKLRLEMKRKEEEAWVKSIEKQFKQMEKDQKNNKQKQNLGINGSGLISGDSALTSIKNTGSGVNF